VNSGLASVEDTIGAGAASRLRRFLVRCVTEAGLRPAKAQQWIPFRRQVLYKRESWDQPRPHSVAVFYLIVARERRDLSFPVNQYYANAVDFDTGRLSNKLVDLGFYPQGSNQEPTIDLMHHNDRAFFDRLFGIITSVTQEFQESLRP